MMIYCSHRTHPIGDLAEASIEREREERGREGGRERERESKKRALSLSSSLRMRNKSSSWSSRRATGIYPHELIMVSGGQLLL